MLVCDLDGTLLDPAGQVTTRSRAAITALRRAGIPVVLASGRLPTAMQTVCRVLELDGPQITMNGALIASPLTGETVAEFALAEDEVRSHLNFAREFGLPTLLCYRDHLKAQELTPEIELLFTPYEEPLPEVVPDLDRLAASRPYKTFFHTGGERYEAVAAAARERFDGRFTITSGNKVSVELLSGKASKEAGARVLVERLGLTMGDVAAIGDAPNDIGLLHSAGVSAAMGQADPQVQDAATFVTTSNSEDGVAAAIARFFPGLEVSPGA
jgi:Cof subfamily protein (haloacid dehalogenase superfamily)